MNRWTWFLLGFAIGLWISVVVLLLRPQPEPHPYHGGHHQGHYGSPAHTVASKLWVPGGDAVYRCTVNEFGGAVIEDWGRAVVDDWGRPVVDDWGRPVVDDWGRPVVNDSGGGNVPANAPNVPAPVPAVLGRSREYQEFWCDLNDHGGPVVRHRSGRAVTVTMLRAQPQLCEYDAGRNAVVVDAPTGPAAEVEVGGDGTHHVTGRQVADSTKRVAIPASVPNTTTFVYCMVAESASDPEIVDADGADLTP